MDMSARQNHQYRHGGPRYDEAGLAAQLGTIKQNREREKQGAEKADDRHVYGHGDDGHCYHHTGQYISGYFPGKGCGTFSP